MIRLRNPSLQSAVRESFQRGLLLNSEEVRAKNANAAPPLLFSYLKRPRNERLIPVVTYFSGPEHEKSVSAALSFMSVVYEDYCQGITMPDPVSSEQESFYMRIIEKYLSSYLILNEDTKKVIPEILRAAAGAYRQLSGRSKAFIRQRYATICQDQSEEYWALLESGSVSRQRMNSSVEISRFPNFCGFILILLLIYGGGKHMRAGIDHKEQEIKNKYGTNPVASKIARFLLPLDFTFLWARHEELVVSQEHRAVLEAIRSIHPHVQVQVLAETLSWVRDTFAWLDDDFTYMLCHNQGIPNMSKGLLSEGGIIVPGTAASRFILVSQEALDEAFTKTDLARLAGELRIKIYALPGGFIWARNPRTHGVIALDSPHIDTVINVVPPSCTIDRRPKVLIDPYYYAMVKDNADFQHFVQEQRLRISDIVSIDERELYLNLANFSVLLDVQGRQRVLFNKDKGYTLSKLLLKPDRIVQPKIEIASLSSFNGSLRCITNMYPKLYIKTGSSPKIIVDDRIPDPLRADILTFLQASKGMMRNVAHCWVKTVHVLFSSGGNSVEADTLKRILFIHIDPARFRDTRDAFEYISESVQETLGRIERQLGVIQNVPFDKSSAGRLSLLSLKFPVFSLRK